MNDIEVPIRFQVLNVQSTTGNTEVTLPDFVTVIHNAAISTTTGNVRFMWENVQVSGNTAINLRDNRRSDYKCYT